MRDDDTQTRPQTSWRMLAGAGVLAALLSFAAVYATLGRPDNASGPPGESTVKATPDKGGTAGAGQTGDLGAFVVRNPPVDLAEVTFKDADGAPKTLGDFKGKAVLLNLWATWCAPCRHEMPSLDRLQREMGSDTFEVVALSLDRAGVEAAAKFFGEIKIENLKLYIDPTMRAGNGLKAVGMPTTILIDKDGREIGRLAGPAEWDSTAAKELIAQTIRKAAAQ